MADKYSCLYKIESSIQCKPGEDSSYYVSLTSSDIVSISYIHNYDVAVFPIIRVRLYVDLTVFEKVVEYPDDVYVVLTYNPVICNMNYQQDNGNGSIQVVDSGKPNTIRYKAYLENKNTPTSIMDSYDQGIQKDSDLNTTRKVPLTLYCYSKDMIHNIKCKNDSIYKNMDITSILTDLTSNSNYTISIDDIKNQTKYDQILLPNISVKDTITFFEKKYGLYPKGGMLYGDGNTLYLVDTDVEAGYTPIPIYVESYKSSSDMGGLKKVSDNYPKYWFNTKAENVSVITETDVERVLNSETITDINVNTQQSRSSTLTKVFADLEEDSVKRINDKKEIDKLSKISTPDTLHKSLSPYISSTNAARITEKVTRVDLSGVGFDVFSINPHSRFNLIFESPIRGMSINQRYRVSNAVHTITNLSSDYFIAQTTMTLCSN